MERLSGFHRIVTRAVLVVGLIIGFQLADVDARELKGVGFPDQITISGEQCSLVGIGVRKKFFIDVYLGGLYLKKPTQDPQEVIRSEQPKRVLLHVVYKQVDADKWVEGWEEGFRKNVPEPDKELRASFDRFVSFFKEPVKKGEEVQVTYLPGKGTEVVVKGQPMGTIPGEDFMAALWSIWFGSQPADESLKEDMLGK